MDAHNLLQQTDWEVIKAKELGESVDSDTTTYRASVRTKANAMETAITNASEIGAMFTLCARNGSGVRPRGDWSGEPSARVALREYSNFTDARCLAFSRWISDHQPARDCDFGLPIGSVWSQLFVDVFGNGSDHELFQNTGWFWFIDAEHH